MGSADVRAAHNIALLRWGFVPGGQGPQVRRPHTGRCVSTVGCRVVGAARRPGWVPYCGRDRSPPELRGKPVVVGGRRIRPSGRW